MKRAILVVVFLALWLPHALAKTSYEAQLGGSMYGALELIYTAGKGLDVENNKIDQLIRTFGWVCVHIPNIPRACRIESELITFLKSLPPNRAAIARELIALGAVCEHREERLDCVFERHVDNAAWTAGSSLPTIDNDFRIDMRVSGRDGTLEYQAAFKRTSTKRLPVE
jgi:hypothetical protein